MTKEDRDFLQNVWFVLADDDFSTEKLANRVFADGGHDMSHLSQNDVLALIEGRFNGDWNDIAFSFSELLYYYVACGNEMTPHQVVGWVFASFVIADAIKRDVAEWERQFDSFMRGFIIVKERLETDQSVLILQRCFC